MGYNKRSHLYLLGIIIISFSISFCSDERDKNLVNSYYVELVNFNDSLRQFISEGIAGKASFFKNNKLEVVSENYLTESYSDIHYFNIINKQEDNFRDGIKKIRVEFIGEYSIDSIRYRLQKYKYDNEQWNKISDMGTIIGTTTFKRAKLFAFKDFVKQIIDNIVYYTYD